MKFLSVDRIEKDHIICEDETGKMHIVPTQNLPPDIKEGSIINLDENGEIKIDKQKTNIRKHIILNLRRKIRSENKKKPKI